MLGVLGEPGFGRMTLGGLVARLIEPDIGGLQLHGVPSAGRVGVIRGGCVFQQVDTALVFRAPASPYTAVLRGAATRATRSVEPVPAAK